jgi:hypothetical protein
VGSAKQHLRVHNIFDGSPPGILYNSVLECPYLIDGPVVLRYAHFLHTQRSCVKTQYNDYQVRCSPF